MDLQCVLCNCVKHCYVPLSVTADVMLTHCTLKIYVLGGRRGTGRPYHADDGSFVSGSIPEDEAIGGWTAGRRNPKHPAAHKGQQFGGPKLNGLSCWR